MNEQQKAAAFDRLCSEIEKKIEDKIPDWRSDNPCFEVDDEDCSGNRTFHYPPTTNEDAREALMEEVLNQADDMGLYDFFEIIFHEIYGEPIRPENSYREEETPAQTKNIMQEICQSFVDLPDKLRKAGGL